MRKLCALTKSTNGSAAAEMALVLPLLLILLMGSLELGNYFMDEHRLAKAVRDGARFAARQAFSNFGCSGTPGGTVVADTKNVVMTGVLSGGTNRLASWNPSTIAVTQSCTTTINSTTLSGIYKDTSNGAPIVTVSASVPYVPVLKSFGFTGIGYSLNADQQAAVMGI